MTTIEVGVTMKEKERSKQVNAITIDRAFISLILAVLLLALPFITTSPDRRQANVGAPLPLTTNVSGSPHYLLMQDLLMQTFAQDGPSLDQDDTNFAAPPTHLPTGKGYQNTINLPIIRLTKHEKIWSQQETILLSQLQLNTGIARIGPYFPLTILGDTAWLEQRLWYHVQWSTPKNIGAGWILSSTVTFNPPNQASTWASFEILSPNFARYLNTLGSNTSVTVYDLSHQRYYRYNSTSQFIAASSIKVPIMVAFLDLLEHQNREPSDRQIKLLTTMIENSNNDSASEIYYNGIGGATGMTNFVQKNGISDLNANPDAWGYSQISTQTMVDLLTRLATGTILTSQHRAIVLDLMHHIEKGQQMGVGDTAPNDASVAMKAGWVTDGGNLWAINSSGIVSLHNESYVIAVYTQAQTSLEKGQAVVRYICQNIAELLT